jgi:hypothetical protein
MANKKIEIGDNLTILLIVVVIWTALAIMKCLADECSCKKALTAYETALSTAKREAVPLADQERGLELFEGGSLCERFSGMATRTR